MKIAIIGGGASGMITAHFLSHKYEVTVFEQASSLGGHIQTINQNAQSNNCPPDIITENGVTGFHYFAQPLFRKLLQSLQVPIRLNLANVTSSIFLKNGKFYEVPSLYTLKRFGPLHYSSKTIPLIKYWKEFFKFYKQLQRRLSLGNLTNLSSEIDQCSYLFQIWLKCGAMLAFSTPYQHTAQFPATKMGLHIQNFKLPCWWYIPGGVYSYIQKIIDLNHRQLNYFCNLKIQSVCRKQNFTEITFANNECARFDKIIFAIPPGEVLKVLSDPSNAELLFFSPWQSRLFPTVAHCDNSIYKQYKKPSKTLCDYFIKSDNTFGYNTYLNHLYQIPHATPYSFAYNLDDQIKADKIIAKTNHIVPVYNTDAYQQIDSIKKFNGNNHTFYVGAYLGDGLQEGATQSALAVSKLLGGRLIDT